MEYTTLDSLTEKYKLSDWRELNTIYTDGWIPMILEEDYISFFSNATKGVQYFFNISNGCLYSSAKNNKGGGISTSTKFSTKPMIICGGE